MDRSSDGRPSDFQTSCSLSVLMNLLKSNPWSSAASHHLSQWRVTGIHPVASKIKRFFLVQANDRKQKYQQFEKEHQNLENEAAVT